MKNLLSSVALLLAWTQIAACDAEDSDGIAAIEEVDSAGNFVEHQLVPLAPAVVQTRVALPGDEGNVRADGLTTPEPGPTVHPRPNALPVPVANPEGDAGDDGLLVGCPDPEAEGVGYVADDLEVCAGIIVSCLPGWHNLLPACGCGCERDAVPAVADAQAS